ncbi:WCX domain-containing protein [Plantactinospora sp. DSM 117369]
MSPDTSAESSRAPTTGPAAGPAGVWCSSTCPPPPWPVTPGTASSRNSAPTVAGYLGSWSWSSLAGTLGRFDADIEVVEPAELRNAFADLARRFARTATG